MNGYVVVVGTAHQSWVDWVFAEAEDAINRADEITNRYPVPGSGVVVNALDVMVEQLIGGRPQNVFVYRREL